MGKELTSVEPASWAIRPYRPGDEPQILALFHRAFGIERSADYWTWKFGLNPLGRQIVLGVTPEDALIGHLAGIPLRVQAEGRPVVFSAIVDLMVDPRYRRGLRKTGVYQTLLGALIERVAGEDRAALMYGIPIRSSNRLGQALHGFTDLYPMTRVVRSLPPEGAALDRPARWRYEIRPVKAFEAWMDRLWARCRADFPLCTVRDSQYMTWRYLQCPHIRYHPYVLWDRWLGRAAAVAVLRLEWQDQPLATVVDWLVPRGDTRAARALLAHLEGVAREHGLGELSAWFFPTGPEHRFLLGHGYREEVMEFPLAARIFTPALSWEWAVRHWYFTMGDSDIF